MLQPSVNSHLSHRGLLKAVPLGRMQIKASFSLKEMMYRGELSI